MPVLVRLPAVTLEVDSSVTPIETFATRPVSVPIVPALEEEPVPEIERSVRPVIEPVALFFNEPEPVIESVFVVPSPEKSTVDFVVAELSSPLTKLPVTVAVVNPVILPLPVLERFPVSSVPSLK